MLGGKQSIADVRYRGITSTAMKKWKTCATGMEGHSATLTTSQKIIIKSAAR